MAINIVIFPTFNFLDSFKDLELFYQRVIELKDCTKCTRNCEEGNMHFAVKHNADLELWQWDVDCYRLGMSVGHNNN